MHLACVLNWTTLCTMINYFWGLQWCQQYKQCLAHKTIGVKDRTWLRLHHHLRILTSQFSKPYYKSLWYDSYPYCISICFENLSQRKSHSNVKKQLSALKLKEGVYFGLSTILKVFVRLERLSSSNREFIVHMIHALNRFSQFVP